MGDEEWRKFTPLVVDKTKCLARTWNGGTGGQCGKNATEGDFCGAHGGQAQKWKVHGRVDGSIPENKLNEFKRAAARLSGAGTAGKSVSSSAAAPKKAAAKAKAPQAAPSSAPKAAASAAGGQKRPRDESQPPAPAAAAAAASASKAPPKAATSGASGPPVGSEKKDKPPVKKPPPALKCTCGCPIHTEKCKLFKPSTAFTTSTTYDVRSGTPPPPRMSGRPPNIEFSDPPKKKIAQPVACVHAWSREQVEKIAMEVSQHKPPQRKAIYRKMLLQYHPDKRNAPESLAEGRQDAELNEVVREIKRRIDALP
eukprot:TRINITY_DN100582_c0_g1_i1.p1 TRINITY_DN100582_c0_g1~~TRINITY_DN100582_c0_g1_i1.p1  ORF type:complete len:311 (+),score=78.33 TRINITY_DN100582_c0_g1_i1:134-1066(+)